MRVSLNKIALIEKFIFNANSLNPEEEVLFQSYSILDENFQGEIENQRKTVELVRKSGRKELRQEMDEVHAEIFHPHSKNPLKRKIPSLFRN
jgi:predicted DNA-binding ArsR family transcriptional regulator